MHVSKGSEVSFGGASWEGYLGTLENIRKAASANPDGSDSGITFAQTVSFRKHYGNLLEWIRFAN